MTLGEKIQQLRKASGISQEQLAEQLEVSRQSVSKWERDEALPDIGKIVLLSQLFSVSTDQLLKDSPAQAAANSESPQGALGLERVANLNLAHKRMMAGFGAIVAGLIMLVLELMFLPVFGAMQKAHVNGQGFYSDFMRYAAMQPMPLIFGLTAAIIFVGVLFLLQGYAEKRRRR